MRSKPDPRPPMNPYLVLAVAAVLPGAGQVVNHQPLRGLLYLFFILLLGAFTLKTASPDVSVVGKLSGGLFVYAMSVLEAYRIARARFEVWRHRGGSRKIAANPGYLE